MKKITILSLIFVLVFSVFCFINTASAATRVRGYFLKSGTYVMPYYKSTPNRTRLDNWSTKGNYNPYTGKKGTVDPFKFRY